MHLEQVLIKPLLTEKTSMVTEGQNRYVFQVQLKANKNHVREAVEKLFNVKVVDVKTSIGSSKLKKTGRFTKTIQGNKKAFVKIQDGQKLDLFKGI